MFYFDHIQDPTLVFNCRQDASNRKSEPVKELAEKLRARRSLPDPKTRRELRKAAGASLSDVAGPCRVSKQTVANWEAGLCVPSGANLAAYLDVLRVLREAA